MKSEKQVYDNSSGAGGRDFSDELLRDDSAPGDMSKNLAECTGNESPLLEQFNEKYQPNNTPSLLASPIPRVPSLNEGSQFDDLQIFNDNIFYWNFDSENGNSSNNLSEGYNFPRNARIFIRLFKW